MSGASAHCRYCDKPIAEHEATTTHSYWKGMPFVCHKACKDSGFKAEAMECQTIDSDCNDCKHFKRERIGTNKEIWFGTCLKFNQPTEAYPNKWTGRQCFEHRKS